MHPTADTTLFKFLCGAGRRVMPGVGQLRYCGSITRIQMTALKCQKCGAAVPVPDLPTESRRSIAAVAHDTGRLQAMLELRDGARIGLGDAKAIVLHLSGKGGACHRCGTRLNEAGEEQDCPKCRSLNLLW